MRRGGWTSRFRETRCLPLVSALSIERAPYPTASAVQDMSVDYRGPDVTFANRSLAEDVADELEEWLAEVAGEGWMRVEKRVRH